MKKVMIAGGFDPFHQGHLDHLKKASKLGDYLLVSVTKDSDLIKKKGKVATPQGFRIDLITIVMTGLGIKGMAFLALDDDGTQVKTLGEYRPNVFAKGGDRTPDNMPRAELEVCRKCNIHIEYGVGNLLNSSSEIMGVIPQRLME